MKHKIILPKECDCSWDDLNDCPTCDMSLNVCKHCGKAESELDQPCTPKAVRMIIAGGRDFKDYQELESALIDWVEDDYSGIVKPNEMIIISGTSFGADMVGEEIAYNYGLVVEQYPADWKNLNAPNAIVMENRNGLYNSKAGIDRNLLMADSATHLLAAWNGKSHGTKHMIDTAYSKGLKVRVCHY